MLKAALRWSAVFAVAWGVVSVVGITRADTPEGISHYIMGSFLEYQGQFDAAALQYRQAASEAPESFPVQMRLGLASSQAGNARQAIDAFNAAIRLQPDNLQAHYLLALVYASVKDFDSASRQYELILKKFSSLEPQNADFYFYLGQLYLTQGKAGQAVAQFEKVLELQPKNVALLLQVGSFYLDHARQDEGVRLLRRCIELDPVNGECLNALGYGYAEAGVNLAEAALLIKRALELEPASAAYLDSLGWVYYRQGNFNDALIFLRQALDKEKDPAIFDHMGDVYQKMNRMDMALEAWRAALKLDDTLVNVRAKLVAGESALKKTGTR